MIKHIYGTANGEAVEFGHTDGNKWEVQVPANVEGEYAVDIYAEDEAGNVSYACRMLFIICGHEVIAVRKMNGFAAKQEKPTFCADVAAGIYRAQVQEGGYAIERVRCTNAH